MGLGVSWVSIAIFIVSLSNYGFSKSFVLHSNRMSVLFFSPSNSVGKGVALV